LFLLSSDSVPFPTYSIVILFLIWYFINYEAFFPGLLSSMKLNNPESFIELALESLLIGYLLGANILAWMNLNYN